MSSPSRARGAAGAYERALVDSLTRFADASAAANGDETNNRQSPHNHTSGSTSGSATRASHTPRSSVAPAPTSARLQRQKSHSFDENTLSRDELERMHSLVHRAPLAAAVRLGTSPAAAASSVSRSPRPHHLHTHSAFDGSTQQRLDVRHAQPPLASPTAKGVRNASSSLLVPRASASKPPVSPRAAAQALSAYALSAARATAGAQPTSAPLDVAPLLAPPPAPVLSLDTSSPAAGAPTVSPYAMLQVSELINTDMPPERVLQRLVDAAQHLVPCERVTFYRLESVHHTVVSSTSASSSSSSASPTATHDDDGGCLVSVVTAPVRSAVNDARAANNLVASSLADGDDGDADIGAPVGDDWAAAAATHAPRVHSERLSANRGLAGYVVKTGRSIRINRDLHTDWRFDAACDVRPLHTVLAVPVRDARGQHVGVLEAINSRSPLPGGGANAFGFSDEDETLFRSMATNICIVLNKAALEFELSSRRKQTQALLQLSEISSSEYGVKKAIQRILRAASSVVDAERIELYLVEDDGSGAAGGVVLVEYETERPLASPGVALQAVHAGRAMLVNNTATDWRIDAATDEDAHFRCLLAVPIKDVDGRCRAVIRAVNKRALPMSPTVRGALQSTASSEALFSAGASGFTHEDQDLLTAVATTAGGTLSVARLYDEAKERNAQTEALLRVSELMSADIGSEKVVPRIIEAAYSLVRAERISLFLVADAHKARSSAMTNSHDGHASEHAALPPLGRKKTLSVAGGEAATDGGVGVASPTAASLAAHKELVCVVSKDVDFQGARIAWGAGIVGHVAHTGRALNIPNAYADARFDPSSDRATGFVTRCILTVPILDRERNVVAVVQAVNCMPHAPGKRAPASFPPEAQALLESMAVSAGTLLRKSQLLSQALHAQRRSNALMRLVKLEAASRNTSMEEAIDGIVQIAYSVLDADRISVFFVDQSRGELFSIVSKDAAFLSVPIGQGIAGHVAKSGRALNVADAYDDPRFDRTCDAQTGYRTRSILCAPIKHAADQSTIGVISVINKRSAAGAQQAQSKLVSAATAHRASLSRQTSSSVAAAPLSPTRVAFTGMSRGASSETLGKGADVAARLAELDRAAALLEAAAEDAPVFNDDDVELLEAFCVEASSIIHRYLSDAIVNQVDAADRASVASLLDAYSSNGKSKSAARLLGDDDDEDGDRVGASAADAQRMAPLLGSRRGTVFAAAATAAASAVTAAAAAAVAAGAAAGATEANDREYFDGVVTIRAPAFAWPHAAPRVQPPTLNTLEFNVWEHSPDELMVFSYQLFQDLGLVDACKIAPHTLQRFVMAVRANYRDNPFHNWYHGFSVLHMAYYMLRQTRAFEALTRTEVLATLVAAVAHDIDHPGRTNVFEVNTRTQRAFAHNDHSVLENHHALTLMCLLRAPECDVTSELSKADRVAFRRVALHGIHSTDMALHFDKCKELDARDAAKPFDLLKDADRLLVVGTVVHAADLGAQTLPTGIAKVWEERISQEFESQAKEEEALGLPVMPFMQNLSNGLHRSKLQVNFIQFVLEPWWRQVVRVWPSLRPCWDGLVANKQFFEMLARIAPPASEAAPVAAAASAPAAATSKE